MNAKTERLSVTEAVHVLRAAGHGNSICLGAEGFWLLESGQVKPSLDHILDLSSVAGSSPRTNASLALAVVEKWPDDPSVFAVELVMTPHAYPCPCCGHLTMSEPPGSYEICDVCWWEDDAVQLRWPTWAGGANRPCLIEAQQNYTRFGANEERAAKRARPATEDEPLDEDWRPVNPDHDSFESRGEQQADWPTDLTTLYWWRPTFWRRRPGDSPPSAMTPSEFAARTAETPDARRMVQEHLADNGELLIHLLMDDLLRESVRLFHSGDVEASSSILHLVDDAIRQGDDALCNAVAVSFVEHAGYGHGETEAFLATWPRGLADELARQRKGPESGA